MTEQAKPRKRKYGKRSSLTFRCYWCQILRRIGEYHHSVRKRPCCQSCYNDLESNYSRIYTDKSSERLEAQRAEED